jgi:hypothetical protein
VNHMNFTYDTWSSSLHLLSSRKVLEGNGVLSAKTAQYELDLSVGMDTLMRPAEVNNTGGGGMYNICVRCNDLLVLDNECEVFSRPLGYTNGVA